MAKLKGERSNFGQILIDHKGKKIPTSVGSRGYESRFGGESRGGIRGTVPPGYAHRPELIANLFLETPNAWWIICEDNAIFDVFEQLKTGDSILLPRAGG